MPAYQPLVLAPVPATARSLTFVLRAASDPRAGLAALVRDLDPATSMLGIGVPLVAALGADVPGLRAFPALSGSGVAVPSTQGALWLLQQGADRGVVADAAARAGAALGDAYRVADDVELFKYQDGRDLSGYVDGTENPKDDAALEAAIAGDGSSFAAVQRWAHDLEWMARQPAGDRDHIIGRRIADNEEMSAAPDYAHVKRAAQESYEPPAFMVRRSMPYINRREKGLLFIAYGESLDRYERVLRRMTGLDDGVVDGLFRFSRPVTGSYFWCAPVRDGRVDLSRIGV